MDDTWWIKAEQLDENQAELISRPINESMLIIGPPGSGKTNLLLLRASQLAKSGKKNVLVILFTRPLKEFIASGSAVYAFNDDCIKTLAGWEFEFMREFGKDLPGKDLSFDEKRNEFSKAVLSVIEENKIKNHYDAVIIDEIQDYTDAEVEIFFKLTNVVYAAGDSNQNLYTEGGVNVDKYFKTKSTLLHHYRNGHKICMVADSIMETRDGFEKLLPSSNYNEGSLPSSVNTHHFPTIEEQTINAAKLIERQLKAYPGERVGVLCATKNIQRVASELRKSSLCDFLTVQDRKSGYESFHKEKTVCICSLHGAKGLEFRTVHLIGVEDTVKSALSRNIIYTAFTRAKTSLDVYYSKNIPPFVDKALCALNPPKKTLALKQLFNA